MITIFHLSTSRSERIIWLMEELALPYTVERLSRQPNLAAPPSLKAVHPLGRAPVIRDGEVVLAESGAIVDYITRRHGGGRLAHGPESPRFAEYLFWLHFAEGSLTPQLLREWYIDLLAPEADDNPVVGRLRQGTADQLSLVEARLASVPYFAGEDFSAADIMMLFPFTTMQNFQQLDMSAFPHTRDYVARITARPAYRRAMAVGAGDAGA